MSPKLPTNAFRSLALRQHIIRRQFSSSPLRREILSIYDLPDRIHPIYSKCTDSKLVSLHWPAPPRNIMLVKKAGVESVRSALVELAEHIRATYPETSIILEPGVASSLHTRLPFPIYTQLPQTASAPFPYDQSTYPRTPHPQQHQPSHRPSSSHFTDQSQEESNPSYAIATRENPFHTKTDLVCTLGGDGTILHAASLFSTSREVPPVLSFSMGTLGFLGEFKWSEHMKALGLVFSSLATAEEGPKCVKGEGCRVLRRGRLKVGVYDRHGNRAIGAWGEYEGIEDAHAMNEVNIHRGKEPHLAIVEVFVEGRFLTEAVADGIIISTPTGSTAYSLSSGGSIIHPAVSSLLLTPICPRSLSFRPLVLPADTLLTLRLSDKNRGRAVEVSVDGRRWGNISTGMEIRVWGETLDPGAKGHGGIPCVKRLNDDDGWVGGLNGLLKFNYPFGEED
ncbi:NADH kinase pos5 [Rhizina undulata]